MSVLGPPSVSLRPCVRVATCGLLLRGTQNAARDIHMRACRNPDRKAGLTNTAWPTRLTRRAEASFLLSSASSRRPPMKLVTSADRLPEQQTKPGHSEQEVAMAASR